MIVSTYDGDFLRKGLMTFSRYFPKKESIREGSLPFIFWGIAYWHEKSGAIFITYIYHQG